MELRRPNVALELGAESQLEAVLAGRKVATCREGYRDYAQGDKLTLWYEDRAVQARVTGVRHLHFKDITDEELTACDFSGEFDNPVLEMQSHYPQFNSGSEATVITFALEVAE